MQRPAGIGGPFFGTERCCIETRSRAFALGCVIGGCDAELRTTNDGLMDWLTEGPVSGEDVFAWNGYLKDDGRLPRTGDMRKCSK